MSHSSDNDYNDSATRCRDCGSDFVSAGNHFPHQPGCPKIGGVIEVEKPEPKWVAVHNHFLRCADGSKNTVLINDGYCPVCDIYPNDKEICLLAFCPKCNLLLYEGKCLVCGVEYDLNSCF